MDDTGAVNEFVIFKESFTLITEVTCVPEGIPVPDRGAPTGGNTEFVCTPSFVDPEATDPLVWKLPLAP